MIRTLLGLPALLLALVARVPDPTVTQTPVAPASPSASPSAGAPTPVLPSTAATAPPLPSQSGRAQSSPMMFPPGPEMMRRNMAEFARTADEQRAFRQTMLAALTPAHRAFLAQLVGQLVIAPNPDLEAATRRFDAVLSRSEATTIVQVEAAKNAAMFKQFERMAAENGLPIPQAPRMPHPLNERVYLGSTTPFGSDPGSIVLRTAALALMMPRIVGPLGVQGIQIR